MKIEAARFTVTDPETEVIVDAEYWKIRAAMAYAQVAIEHGKMVDAIKAMRHHLGCGLKTAHSICTDMRREYRNESA